MPRKKSTKSATRTTALEQITELQSMIANCEEKLISTYEKASEHLQKQLIQGNNKCLRAKEKVALNKQKLQDAKAKRKLKKTQANENRVIKMQELLADSKAQLNQLKADQDALALQFTKLTQSQKKLNARKKALTQFEKAWKNLSKPAKKVKKKRVTKKSNTRKLKDKGIENKKMPSPVDHEVVPIESEATPMMEITA